VLLCRLDELVVLLQGALEDLEGRAGGEGELVEQRCLVGGPDKAGDAGWRSGEGEELGED
jgi:hypothetical protein